MVAQKEKNRRDLGTILRVHNVGIPNGQKASAIGTGPSLNKREERDRDREIVMWYHGRSEK